MKKTGKILTGLFILASVLFVTGCKTPSLGADNYTIHYESEHGTVPADTTVDSGYKLTEADLPELTDENFNFNGWYIGEEKAAIDTEVTSDITLKANWTEKSAQGDPNQQNPDNPNQDPQGDPNTEPPEDPEADKKAGTTLNLTFIANDITVTPAATEYFLIFTPAAGYSDYTWTINGQELDENCSVDANGVLTFDSTFIPFGTYTFTLKAKKDGITYTTCFEKYFEDVSVAWPGSQTVKYVLRNNKLHIMGEGTLPDVASNSSYDISGIENVTECTVDKGITAIGKCVFMGLTSLETLKGCEGVTSIGESAMEGMSNLKTIPAFNKVTTTGNAVFKGAGITSINGFNKLEIITESMFENCSSLTTITGFRSLKKIQYNAFNNCGVKTFNFGGPKEDWNNIDRNKYGNDAIKNAEKTYDND